MELPLPLPESPLDMASVDASATFTVEVPIHHWDPAVAEHTTALYDLVAGNDGVEGEVTVATTESGFGVTYNVRFAGYLQVYDDHEPTWAELEMRNDGVEVPAPEELP